RQVIAAGRRAERHRADVDASLAPGAELDTRGCCLTLFHLREISAWTRLPRLFRWGRPRAHGRDPGSRPFRLVSPSDESVTPGRSSLAVLVHRTIRRLRHRTG